MTILRVLWPIISPSTERAWPETATLQSWHAIQSRNADGCGHLSSTDDCLHVASRRRQRDCFLRLWCFLNRVRFRRRVYLCAGPLGPVDHHSPESTRQEAMKPPGQRERARSFILRPRLPLGRNYAESPPRRSVSILLDRQLAVSRKI